MAVKREVEKTEKNYIKSQMNTGVKGQETCRSAIQHWLEAHHFSEVFLKF